MTAHRSTVEARTWTIPLPYTKPPLSLNGRLHWRAKAAITKDLRDLGIVYARKLRIPPLDRFTVVLHYAPRDNRDRDLENIAPTSKPVVDGICQALAMKDTREHYIPSAPVIHDGTGEPGRLWLVLFDITDPAPTETEAN